MLIKKKRVNNGTISKTTSGKYINYVKFTKKYFEIYYTDKKMKNAIFCQEIKANTDAKFQILPSVINAYNLFGKIEIEEEQFKSNAFRYYANCIGELPKKISGMKIVDDEKAIFSENEIIAEKEIVSGNGISIPAKKVTMPAERIVTVHTGKYPFIEIREKKASDEKYPTKEELAKVFNSHFSCYSGECMTYQEKIKTKNKFVILKFFMDRIGIKLGEKMRIACQKDKLLILPPNKKCEISGETIDISKESIEKIHICNECNEDIAKKEESETIEVIKKASMLIEKCEKNISVVKKLKTNINTYKNKISEQNNIIQKQSRMIKLLENKMNCFFAQGGIEVEDDELIL